MKKEHDDINFSEMTTILQKIQYASLYCLGATIRFLGTKITYGIADFFAFLAWHLLRKRRKLTICSLAEHLHIGFYDAKKIAYKSFQSTFRSFSEIGLTKDFGIELTGKKLFIADEDLWKRFQESERAIVAATGHYGSWELLASLLGQVFPEERPRMVVVRKYPNPAVQQFIANQREARGASMIGHRAVATSVLRALRKNGLVAFLIDHKSLSHESYIIPFLEENARVNIGPALLAVRAEALIWPIFLERTSNGYLLHLQEPLDTKTLEGTSEQKIKMAATFYTKAMEKQILYNPEQWFWMHNRWDKKY